MKSGKLVRDRIPEIIRGKGEVPIVERCCRADRRGLLLDKFIEEHGEYLKDGVDELVDVLEVVEALAAEDGVVWGELLRRKARKRAERGGFVEGWVWFGNEDS